MLSKLALHVTKGSPEAIEAIDSLENPQFIKVMELTSEVVQALKRLRERQPTVMIGYRMWFEDDRMDDLSEDNWKHMCQDMFQEIENSGAIDLIELVFTPYNERFMLLELGLEKYVAELPKIAMYLRKLWRKAGKEILIAGGNFSATTPRINEWDIVAKCFKSLDFISVHEYAQPTLLDLPEVLYAHEEVIKRHPDMPLIIIGECGIDHALYTTPPDYRGWKANLTSDEYVEQLDGYHLHISTNAKVFASCIFQIGDPNWFMYATDSNIVLDVFNKSYPKEQIHIPRVKSREVQTWHNQQVHKPKSNWTDEELSGPRNWLPNELSKTFTDWRWTEGNTWPPHTDIERSEFWKHARRLKIPVDHYLNMNKIAMSLAKSNENNSMIETLAHLINVDKVLLKAIIYREGHGRAFGPGRVPLVRAEAHIIIRDAHNKGAINRILRVNGPRSWEGHQYFENGRWRNYHGDQLLEQKVVALCAIVDEEAAYSGTSFGLFQIMGKHYSRLGFKTAQEMAKNMRILEFQYYSFAMFCATGGCLDALRNDNIEAFVHEFNGEAMVTKYSAFIRQYIKDNS